VALSTGESHETLRTLLDVTDLVEFLERGESVSGVQRVVAETAPLLMEREHTSCVLLDRRRGVFVELAPGEVEILIQHGARSTSIHSRDAVADAARGMINRAGSAPAVVIDEHVTLVFLGALWINDALMIAARQAHAQGARIVDFLYDLTPVTEAGHTAAVNRLFDRYLTLIAQVASRVPAISRSSRSDFEAWTRTHGLPTPPGEPTCLPCGLTPDGRDLSIRPWPRPYVLFVGTVESRKNHALALRAWRQLVDRHGERNVPDLVCVGRLGWNAGPFLREFVHSRGLEGKVSVLSGGVEDEHLARFYAHADFTLYPSAQEGWGLPVSESLAFGKVPVVARNSSLPEAGGGLALYFESNELTSLVCSVEEAMDPDLRREREARIRESPPSAWTWNDVAHVLAGEIDLAERRPQVYPTIELGREYVLAVPGPAPDEGYADRYRDYLVRDGLTPLLRQPRGDRDYEVIDAAVIGAIGSPQSWGYEVRPGRYVEVRFTRPTSGPLVVLMATRAMPGKVFVEMTGPGGPVLQDLYLGSVLTILCGDGLVGEPAQALVRVVDASDSIEGFLGIRSLVVLRADDKDARIVALESAADALRQELDFIQGTRSWKVTAPLRKWKGRGA
jgi:glycosyltransferase involved in cell wall biosynthesis